MSHLKLSPLYFSLPSLTKGLVQSYSRLFKAITLLILSSIFLTGCNSTSASNTEVKPILPSFERLDPKCVAQVKAQQAHLDTASTGQYLSLANSAQHCIDGQVFSSQHPDLRTAMQFSALAFTNFVKAGDMQSASLTLDRFRKTFGQQDLLFDDFTSFVDTATVLTRQHELSAYELTTLNINPQLRAEIKRARNWSLQ